MADAWAVARWGIVALMLAGGSILDLRSRRVPNRYWLPFVALALLFLLRDAVVFGLPGLALPYGAAALLAGFLYALWRLGLFGGADAKALMVAAFLAPHPLATPIVPRFPPLPMALDALGNGALLLVALPVLLAAWNLAHGRATFPALLLGVPMAVAKAQAAHVWPLQRVEDGALRWRYWTRIQAGGDPYAGFAETGIQTVWVTPKIPFLVPVTVGWLLAAGPGNLALFVVAQFV
ncbi:MAG: prepilin peptidase [Candidatus Thermoplasmatota archaeon]